MADPNGLPVARHAASGSNASLDANTCSDARNAALIARRLLAERARIGRCLDPDLFADPAYDILLDLFASGEEGLTVSMSSGACAARVARTTALRWIRLLEARGLIERYADDGDRRSTLIRLTPSSRASLMLYLQQIAQVRALV